jgi:hypothetical protein
MRNFRLRRRAGQSAAGSRARSLLARHCVGELARAFGKVLHAAAHSGEDLSRIKGARWRTAGEDGNGLFNVVLPATAKRARRRSAFQADSSIDSPADAQA